MQISIHAPRVGRDNHRIYVSVEIYYFNPRAPCGARPQETIRGYYVILFQSTRPVWGATTVYRVLDGQRSISIHAPRVGRDTSTVSYTHLTLPTICSV